MPYLCVTVVEIWSPAKLNDLMTKVLKLFLSSIVDVDSLNTTILGEYVEKFFNEVKQGKYVNAGYGFY